MIKLSKIATGVALLCVLSGLLFDAAGQQLDEETSPSPVAQAEPVVQPDPAPMPPIQTIGGNQWTEDFDSGTLRGWELLPGAAFAQGASGVMLAPDCPGRGLWAAVTAKDLLLEFDFLQGTGTAVVVLSLFELPSAPGGHYVVVFAEGVEVGLLRKPAGAIQVVSGGQIQLSPGSWYRVSILMKGGAIDVAVDGTNVLSAVDPQPFGGGVIGFGCRHGSGFGFDSISITSPDLPPEIPQRTPAIPINIPEVVVPGNTDSSGAVPDSVP